MFILFIAFTVERWEVEMEIDRSAETKEKVDFRSVGQQIYYVDSIPKGHSVKVIIFVIILIILLILAAFMGAMGFTAYRLADSGSFDMPARISSLMFWDKDFGDYTKSGMLLENGIYEEAAAHFKSLGDYRNSEEFYKASLYGKSIKELGDGKLEDALDDFTELGNYQDSVECVQKIKEAMYAEAVKLFSEGSYNKAGLYFDKAGIEDSEKYRTVIDVIQGSKYIYALEDIVEFQPARDCLMMNETTFLGFMQGDWYSEDRELYISVGSDDVTYYISYNLPRYDYSGDYFTVENGGMYFFNNEDGSDKELNFIFQPEDWDTVNVTCADGMTYTLFRE